MVYCKSSFALVFPPYWLTNTFLVPFVAQVLPVTELTIVLPIYKKRLEVESVVDGETNLIGFHADGDYRHAVGESYALMGMTLFAEYLDAIAVITISAGGA